MWGYVRDIYQTKGIEETVDSEHIKSHYQVSLYIDLIRYGCFIIYEDIIHFSRNKVVLENTSKYEKKRENDRP